MRVRGRKPTPVTGGPRYLWAYLSDRRTRKRRRLATWLEGDGIEIGALFRPLVVPVYARVRYVDRMAVDDLRHHYPELDDLGLVPVDVIGSAEDLSAFAGESVNFVVANHLVEHLEYPIRAFKEFHRVLRPDGTLYMALPDQRIGIDQDRELTTVDHLLGEHRGGGSRTRAAHYLDWARKVEKRTSNDARARARELNEADYSIHFHVWRADTFLKFFFAACDEEALQFQLVGFAPPQYPGDDEFIVVLRKGLSPAPPLSRTATLRTRVVRSRLGPRLRPIWRTGRRLLRTVRSLVFRPSRNDGVANPR